MTRSFVVLSFLLLLLFVPSQAQDSLTNEDVVTMVRSEIGLAVIEAKIDASAPRFDVSTEGLVKLKDDGVPSNIIAMMVRRQADFKSALNNTSEQGTLKDLDGKKQFFVDTIDLKARDRITKQLVKAGFSSVDKIEAAEFVVEYKEWKEPLPASNHLTKWGMLSVAVLIPTGDSMRRREIYSARKEKYYVFTAEPAESAANQFVKDLKASLKL